MHLPALPRFFFICLFLVAFSKALRVAPTSPCLAVCGDATTTNGSDIVCNDDDFANTPTGRKFKECISCELNSTTFDTASGTTDLQWLLYNLRYELSWCVWGFPNATGIGDTPCVTSFACGVFQSSIETLSPEAGIFDYCEGFNLQYISQCHNCLEELDSELYLSNFLAVLQAGCEQKPFNGQALTLSGSLFSTDPISIVNASTSTSTFNPSKSGPLTLGGKVGIAVGGFVLILIFTGCLIVCRGKRRRRTFLAAQNRRNKNMMEADSVPGTKSAGLGATERRHTPSPPMPPILQTGNFEWHRPDKYPTSSPEDGSVSGNEKNFPCYSSLYSSPVSGSEAPSSAVTMNQVYPWIVGGLGDTKEGNRHPMSMVREQSGDDIELQRMEPKVDLDIIKEVGKRGYNAGVPNAGESGVV